MRSTDPRDPWFGIDLPDPVRPAGPDLTARTHTTEARHVPPSSYTIRNRFQGGWSAWCDVCGWIGESREQYARTPGPALVEADRHARLRSVVPPPTLASAGAAVSEGTRAHQLEVARDAGDLRPLPNAPGEVSAA